MPNTFGSIKISRLSPDHPIQYLYAHIGYTIPTPCLPLFIGFESPADVVSAGFVFRLNLLDLASILGVGLLPDKRPGFLGRTLL